MQDVLESPDAHTGETLRRAGNVIKEMHNAGIFHADLQLRNILVENDTVLLIDFDNASVHSKLSLLQRQRNLLRLKRSFIKNHIPLAYFDALAASYGMDSFPDWLQHLYRARGASAP